MAEKSTISQKISIGDQSFSIRIHPDEKSYYDRIAKYVETAHADVRKHGVVGGPQVWAMTAFQIAIELFDTRTEAGGFVDEQERVKKMIRRIEAAMPKE